MLQLKFVQQIVGGYLIYTLQYSEIKINLPFVNCGDHSLYSNSILNKISIDLIKKYVNMSILPSSHHNLHRLETISYTSMLAQV